MGMAKIGYQLAAVKRWAQQGVSALALAASTPMIGAAETERARKAAERELFNKAYMAARALLMSGPRATPPRHNTVLSLLRQQKLGLPIDRGRRIRLVEPALNEHGYTEHLLHPTKGYRS